MIAKGGSFGKSQEEQRQKIELQIVEVYKQFNIYKRAKTMQTHINIIINW